MTRTKRAQTPAPVVHSTPIRSAPDKGGPSRSGLRDATGATVMTERKFETTQQSYLVIAFNDEHQPIFSGAVVCTLDAVRAYAETTLSMHAEYSLVQIFDLSHTKAQQPVREPIEQITLPWA